MIKNNKLIYGIAALSLFITPAIVLASPSKVVRVEDTITSSNSTGSSTNSGSSSTSGSSTTALYTSNYSNTGVCNDFTVKRTDRIKPDPYASDGQAFNIYSTTPNCSSTSATQYVSFCINPELPGPITSTAYHSNQTLDLNTTFGKYMFTLYHLYKQSGSCSDEACIARWQAAARILQYDTGEFLPSKRNLIQPWQKRAYDNWKSGNIIGTEIEAARQIADTVKSTASTASANGGNMSVNVEQLGDTTYQNGTTFTAKYNIILENTTGYTGIQTPTIVWKSGDNVVSGYNTSISGPTQDGDNLTYTLTVTGNVNTSDCSGYTMEIHVKYNNENDINAASVISPDSATLQRFVIFQVGNTGEKVASTNVNPGNTTCSNKVNACTTSGNLTCTDNDVSTVVVNEGVQPGTSNTDWEACIIGKTDEQGNDYDIQEQNSSSYIGTENADEYTDDILATLSNGTKVTNSTYCTISCKEEYSFKLPGGEKQVKQGTYFSFDVAGGNPYHAVAGVISERKCVTSGQNVSGSNTNNVDYSAYEKVVMDLRKQQVDYLNAYLYYKAIYDAMDKSANQDKYINESKQNYEVTNDGGHLNDWESGATESSMSNQYNANGEGYWNAAYTPKFDLENFVQYKITNPNSGDSAIEKVSVATTSEKSFEDNASLTKYNKSSIYNSIYEEKYQIFEKNAFIDENSKTASGGYTYHYDVCTSWDRSLNKCTSTETRHDGNAAIDVKYNTAGRDNKLAIYNTVKENMAAYAQAAMEKYNALSRQISAQASSMATCSGYLDEETNKYKFDPQITFSYDQDNYMQMLGSSKLVNAGSSTPALNTTIYYCTGAVNSAADVFNCSTTKPQSIDFKYMPVIEYGETPNTTDAEYYQVTRIGSLAKYTCDGTTDSFCYYRSQVPFYTYPQDGLATNKKDVANSTIIEKDGYVYPVTITTAAGVHNYKVSFKQIGQYFESGYLGRIMGGNGGKVGTRSGEEQDYEACYYDVCPTTDPNCGNTNNACAQIVTDSCKGGNVNAMTIDEYAACINALIKDNNCCDEATDLANKSNGALPPDVVASYNAVCSYASTCKSFTIYNSTDNLYDVASVDNNGELQFSVKSVSLNNLFPNNTVGTNWQTASAQSTATEIESNGESVYGNDPDYQIKLTPTCIAAIKEYNSEQSDSGGLTDFTGYISTSSEYKAGSASYSTFLSKLNDMGCVYSGTKTDNIDPIE